MTSNFVLGGEYFSSDSIGDVTKVVRLPITPAPQSVIDTASSTGNLNPGGSINYANIYGKGNYEQLAAPNRWMDSLANDPVYFQTIDQSTGGAISNTAFGLAGGGEVLSSTNLTNTDANQTPTTDAFPNLRYPLRNDGSFDFLKITCYKYVSAGFDTSGSLTSITQATDRIKDSIGSVALPMQPGISESNSVGWGQDSLNALQIAGAKMAGNLMSDLSQLKLGEAATGFVKNIQSAVGNLAGDLNEAAITSYFAGQAVGANIFTRGTGQVLNPNLELLFSGPNLRTFNYTYRFTPRESGESEQIKQIIKFFKKNMAPQKSTNGTFLQTPNVFKLKYIYANGDTHPFLNNIKMCALTGFTVDYTPDGSYMTYKDGSMTSYQISMQFNELDPIYSEDYDKGEGLQGMGY